jgi:rhodanese-related sulfurtransferase
MTGTKTPVAAGTPSTGGEEAVAVTTISREELRLALGRGDVVLLDAQAPGWYEREHLPGAVKMPELDHESQMREIAPDHGIGIVVYCWSNTCSASALAARLLRGLGYRGGVCQAV